MLPPCGYRLKVQLSAWLMTSAQIHPAPVDPLRLRAGLRVFRRSKGPGAGREQ